ncbi:MAG TPA: GNAT family N-acetyltransferase [Gaiellaceae bacterium]|nr:GNAT family N-acetyltransferase [Gaiellaceae bacterium]
MSMSVRRAGSEDFEAVAGLWREFEREIPPPVHEDPAEHGEAEIHEIEEILATEIAFVAEGDGGAPVGFALLRRRPPSLTLTDLYVKPDARGSGLAKDLMRRVVQAARDEGAEYVDLEVMASNALARSLYARWGFRDEVIVMVAEVAALEARLGPQETASFGSIHVQSDDLSAVEQAVRQFVPRLPGGSRGSLVAPPRNGWIAVYDDVCDRNPEMLRRLARELSDRLGAVAVVLGVERDELVRMIVLERGSIVDEYLSVPEYYGPLPPGDVVGLSANPRVVSRLTGAAAEEVRRIARTAVSAGDLPPARELLAELASALGVAGAEHGWADAPQLAGAVRVERG